MTNLPVENINSDMSGTVGTFRKMPPLIPIYPLRPQSNKPVDVLTSKARYSYLKKYDNNGQVPTALRGFADLSNSVVRSILDRNCMTLLKTSFKQSGQDATASEYWRSGFQAFPRVLNSPILPQHLGYDNFQIPILYHQGKYSKPHHFHQQQGFDESQLQLQHRQNSNHIKLQNQLNNYKHQDISWNKPIPHLFQAEHNSPDTKLNQHRQERHMCISSTIDKLTTNAESPINTANWNPADQSISAGSSTLFKTVDKFKAEPYFVVSSTPTNTSF